MPATSLFWVFPTLDSPKSSAIVIQTHEQPVDGNNAQLRWGILSLGILTNKLKFNAFVSNVGESPMVASPREYILMHHAKRRV